MGGKGKGKGGKQHSQSQTSKEELEELILAICQTKHAAAQHGLQPGPGGKIRCDLCKKNNIAPDKKTCREHMKSKEHLIAKGDLEEEKDPEVTEGDVERFLGTEFDASILEHPQLCGVVLDYLPVQEQMICLALSPKIHRLATDILVDLCVSDLLLLFQPRSVTRAQPEMVARRDLILGADVHLNDQQKTKYAYKNYWEKNSALDATTLSHADFTAANQSNAKDITQLSTQKKMMRQSTLRLGWALKKLRRNHKDQKKADYWIHRLKAACFTPLPEKMGNEHDNDDLVQLTSSTECFLVLPPGMRLQDVPAYNPHRGAYLGNQQQPKGPVAPLQDVLYAHIRDKLGNSLTIVQWDIFHNTRRVGELSGYFDKVKKADIILPDCNLAGETFAPVSGWQPFPEVTHLTLRNVSEKALSQDPPFLSDHRPSELTHLTLVGIDGPQGNKTLKVGPGCLFPMRGLQLVRYLGITKFETRWTTSYDNRVTVYPHGVMLKELEGHPQRSSSVFQVGIPIKY